MLLLLESSSASERRASRRTCGRGARAFSLVEVTIALGVIAVVMAAIAGLLSGSFTISREAANDTALTAIVRNVVDDLRGRPLDEVPGLGANEVRYFYENGSPCSESSDAGAAKLGAIYKCTISGAPDPETQSADGTANMVKLQIHAAWPLIAGSTAEPNKRDIYVNIARY